MQTILFPSTDILFSFVSPLNAVNSSSLLLFEIRPVWLKCKIVKLGSY